MARELGVPLMEIVISGGRLRRYGKAVAATVRVLIERRPRVVFASNPSLVLTYLLLVCRLVFRFRFVSDAHYGGVVAVAGGRPMQRLLDFLNRRADLVIVTNPRHADSIRRLGGTPFVCPDPLPTVPAAAPPAELQDVVRSVLFICSYEVDEPFTQVFEAARLLAAEGVAVFASGSYSRAGIVPADVPQVRFLGYVDRPTYDGFLGHVDVILDLTTWEDCLVCGAYEAMAAGKPCVLSRTPSLTSLFTHGTVFTAHDPPAIARAVLEAFDRRQALRTEIEQWVPSHVAQSRACMAAIRTAVGLPLEVAS
jgi:glycosyltransferase involved in cell wall biosynthesis